MSRPTEWKQLDDHYQNNLRNTHLSELLKDETRNASLLVQHPDLLLDISHEKIDTQTIKLLAELTQTSNLRGKIEQLFNGEVLNYTEKRAVLHTSLRAPLDSKVHPESVSNILADVHQVLKAIREFSGRVRSGQHKGATGKSLKNLVVIGIGGSYLSIQFVYEALRSHQKYSEASNGRKLRFLANVDPIDFHRSVQGLNVEQTLFLVNSKTFTTAQTILNAKSCRKWLLEQYQKLGVSDQKHIVGSHMCACSTNLEQTSKFGISKENVFGFWDFVGGRFSVWSAIGILPLSVQFGYDVAEEFLQGGHSIDTHFVTEKSVEKNVPLLLGLIGFYCTSIQNASARAIVPYCQALSKFAPHIQQLDMESNGKRINKNGETLQYETAVVNFGEPGTNGQHSFFQLLHQGRIIPVEFIGFTKSQVPFTVEGEAVSNHDELMSNFFSQPDALAVGKTIDQLKLEGTKQELIPHKQFPGDRPSLSLLFLGELDAFKCGELLAIYEHRTSVQGFLWGVNSYDQWGVELGKVLAKNIRQNLKENKIGEGLNSATQTLVEHYLKNK